MSNLEPRIEAVRAKYDLDRDDFWQIKQNKQWVCKHAALEIVAVKAGIEWMPPQIIEANAPSLVTSMVVTGKMGNRVEWATGETNATNYSVSGKQPAYPWAMAEKRAKDRVVLKLVGIHGLVYSEDEAEDFKAQAKQPVPEPPKADPKPAVYNSLVAELNKAVTSGDIGRMWRDQEFIDLRSSMSEDWQAKLKDEATKIGNTMKAKETANDTVKDIQDAFPGSTVRDERVTDVSGRELEFQEAGE